MEQSALPSPSVIRVRHASFLYIRHITQNGRLCRHHPMRKPTYCTQHETTIEQIGP